jgi:hypothetical protein
MPTRIVSLLPSATELIYSVLDQHEKDVIKNRNAADDASAVLVGREYFCMFECNALHVEYRWNRIFPDLDSWSIEFYH